MKIVKANELADIAKKKVAVTVGRFQTENLHEGHRLLLDTLYKNAFPLIIAVGVKERPDKDNPLDYPTIEAMLKKDYPFSIIVPIKDCQCNSTWSKNLDNLIYSIIPTQCNRVMLFGGKDSFLKNYCGRYNNTNKELMYELDSDKLSSISATTGRNMSALMCGNSTEFRKGAIYAMHRVPNQPIMCVDGAVFMDKYQKIILIHKDGEIDCHGSKLYRFPGGHVDNTDINLEMAIRRELKEEIGDIEISDPVYISSSGVSDYRNTYQFPYFSSLFVAHHVYGAVLPGDDAKEIMIFDTNDIESIKIVPEHEMFRNDLIKYLKSNTVMG